MWREVARRRLRSDRRALLWWCSITALLAFLITLIYPTYRDQAAAFEDFWEQAPAFMRSLFGEEFDFGTPEGFLSAEIYSTLAPLLFTIFAIGAGSRAVAGEEQEGTLEVLLSLPVSRAQIVGGAFAAMVAGATALALSLAGALAAGAAVVGMSLNPGRLAGATVLTALLGLVFGSIALLMGAAWRGKGRAVGIATGLAVVTFLLNGLAPLVDWLRPLRIGSPWYWFTRSTPLRHGAAAGELVVLALVVVVAASVAARAFNRRDVVV